MLKNNILFDFYVILTVQLLYDLDDLCLYIQFM